MGLISDIKKDPVGATLAVCVPMLVAFSVSYVLNNPTTLVDRELTGPSINIPDSLDDEPENPPAKWLAEAGPDDVMSVPGRDIAYWGRPDVNYGPTDKAQPFKGIVMHFTLPARRGTSQHNWVVRLIKYQHNGDMSLGFSRGYHFYISRDGKIYQGAPLTYRTNHVKGSRSRHRKRGPSQVLDNVNALSISMIGACLAVGEGLGSTCVGEEVTPEQMAAGKDLIAALKDRYNLGCLIFGHGEMQSDRAIYEGATMAQHIRNQCEAL